MGLPDNDRDRPEGNRTASNVISDGTSSILPPGSADAVQARRAWAYGMVRKVPAPPPPYGSPEWLALPDGDVRKVVAVVIAAESWARDGDDLEERLRMEVEALSLAYKQREDADYAADVAAHADRWRYLSNSRRGPCYIPLKRERAGGPS